MPTTILRSGAVRTAWAWPGKVIAALVARSRARQTERELAVLSDRELRDVGLLRADLHRVAANGRGRRR